MIIKQPKKPITYLNNLHSNGSKNVKYFLYTEHLELATETLFTESAMNKYLVFYHLACNSCFFLSFLEDRKQVISLKTTQKISTA